MTTPFSVPSTGTRPQHVGFVVVLVAVSLLAMFSRGAPWRGEWQWTFDVCLGTTVLSGPLVAAAAAWRVAADRRRSKLTDPTPRGWALPIAVAAEVVLLAGAGYLATTALAIGMTVSVKHGGPAPWLVLLVGPVLLVCYAAMGVFSGYSWPHLVTVPAVGLLAFGIGVAESFDRLPNVLRQGPVTGTLAGVTWDLEVLVSQLIVLLGATAALLLGAGAWQLRRTRSVVVGIVLAVALSASGVVALVRGGDERFVVSGEAATACQGARPRVCVAPSNSRVLASLSAQVDRAATPLRKVGVELPGSYVQLLPATRPMTARGIFALSPDNDATTTLSGAAGVLVRPAPCPQWFGQEPPPQALFDVTDLVAAWITTQGGDEQNLLLPGAAEWLSRPIEQQAPWVRSAFAALQSCDMDALRLPWE